jgi:hypothetical protein
MVPPVVRVFARHRLKAAGKKRSPAKRGNAAGRMLIYTTALRGTTDAVNIQHPCIFLQGANCIARKLPEAGPDGIAPCAPMMNFTN